MHSKDAMDFVRDMGVGWNLGNSLDAVGPDETAWGNPEPTRELIDAVAARGFKTIRIPVTWRMHMGGAPDYTIEKAWMDRVAEVVDYALANDLYVILNTHHEGEWALPVYAHSDEVARQLCCVWSQIATRFRDCDDHLIFEPLNEPRLEGSPKEWCGGTEENCDCINQWQQAAIDTIRATGGNNRSRMIMVAPHGASNTPNAINALVVPEEDPNILISIHNYFPPDFCLMEREDWGSEDDIQALKASFKALDERFLSQGRAVVLGEWGSINHTNSAARLQHAAYYMREARQYGMCAVWWDNGYPEEFGLMDRKTRTWIFPEMVDQLLESAP